MVKKSLTLDQKLQTLVKLQSEPKTTNEELYEWLHASFGVSVSRSTLSRLRHLRESDFRHANMAGTRTRRVKFPAFEARLREYYLRCEAEADVNAPLRVTEELVFSRARELMAEMGISPGQLTLSNGWMDKFKRRNGFLRAGAQSYALKPSGLASKVSDTMGEGATVKTDATGSRDQGENGGAIAKEESDTISDDDAVTTRLLAAVLSEMRALEKPSPLTLLPDAWFRIMQTCNYGRDGALRLDREQLQRRLWEEHKRYCIFHAVVQELRCSWQVRDDDVAELVALDEDWGVYLQTHPEAEPFREKPLRNYSKLREIFPTASAARSAIKLESEPKPATRKSPRTRQAKKKASAVAKTPSASSEKRMATRATPSPSPAQSEDPSVVTMPLPAPALPSTPTLAQSPAPAVAPSVPTAAVHTVVGKTQTQIAIADFLGEFRGQFERQERLRFVKFLTAHPEQAETYNVLDAETKEDLVLDFLAESTSSNSTSGAAAV